MNVAGSFPPWAPRDVLRLATDEDRERRNPLGHPLCFWRPASVGQSFVNPHAAAVLHTVLWDDRRPLWDRYTIVDGASTVFVLQLNDRWGLVPAVRATGPRLFPAEGKTYAGRVDVEGRWGELLGSLGHPGWEAPRAQQRPGGDPAQILAEVDWGDLFAAQGLRVGAVESIGRINPHPQWFAHPADVLRVRLEGADTETFVDFGGNAGRMCTVAEVRELVASGGIECALTLAALARAGFAFS